MYDGYIRRGDGAALKREVLFVRYVFAVCISIILIVLFFFSLFSVSDYGVVSLILAGASGCCLYKLYMFMFKSYKSGGYAAGRSSGKYDPAERSHLFQCIFFGDSTGDDPDDWRK